MKSTAILLSMAIVSMPAFARDNSQASAGPEFTNIALQLENDAFTFERRDRWYSNGFKFNWVTSRSAPPRWLEYAGSLVPLFDRQETSWWGWSIEQRLFTPEDISNPDFPPADRPYAGWMNLSFSMAILNGNHVDRFHIGVGLVGEGSLARETQNVSHDLIGSAEPVGWETQLPNEPTFLLAYGRQWRLGEQAFEGGYGSDWAPAAGVGLSNAITQIEAGVFWRFGRNLPDDFGPPRITVLPNGEAYFRATAASGWYFCIGLNGIYVPHNLFLDGTTLRSSPSVNSKPFVGEAFAGFVYYFSDLRLLVMASNASQRPVTLASSAISLAFNPSG